MPMRLATMSAVAHFMNGKGQILITSDPGLQKLNNQPLVDDSVLINPDVGQLDGGHQDAGQPNTSDLTTAAQGVKLAENRMLESDEENQDGKCHSHNLPANSLHQSRPRQRFQRP